MITVDLSNIYTNMYLIQIGCILIGITGIFCFLKAKRILASILIIVAFAGYFKAKEYYDENRDTKLLSNIQQRSGNTAIALMCIEFDDQVTYLTYSSPTKEKYKFKVIGEYWCAKQIELELIK